MAKQAKSGSTSLTTSEPPPAVEDVNQVFEWTSTGHSEHHVLDATSGQLGGQPPRPLIDAAWERICETGDAPISGIIAWAIEACRLAYQKMMETAELDQKTFSPGMTLIAMPGPTNNIPVIRYGFTNAKTELRANLKI